MAADQPDRNLRFILGHAFTLDKLMLRVVEIESESSEGENESSSDDDGLPTTTNPKRERRVSFQNNAKPHVTATARNRSPPPRDYEDDSDEELLNKIGSGNQENEMIELIAML